MRPITCLITYVPYKYGRYKVSMYHAAQALGLDIDFDNYDMDNMEEIDGFFVYLRVRDKYIDRKHPLAKEWITLYKAEAVFWDLHWLKYRE